MSEYAASWLPEKCLPTSPTVKLDLLDANATLLCTYTPLSLLSPPSFHLQHNTPLYLNSQCCTHFFLLPFLPFLHGLPGSAISTQNTSARCVIFQRQRSNILLPHSQIVILTAHAEWWLQPLWACNPGSCERPSRNFPEKDPGDTQRWPHLST